MKRLLVLLLTLTLNAGCQTVPLSPRLEPVAAPVAAPLPAVVETLQQLAARLPGAELSTPDGNLLIAYPQASLFAPGAVLPMPGGPEVLDPLANYLKADPAARWDAKVMAATSNGSDYDLALAQKRSELLQRYLRNRGVVEGQILWGAQSGEGIPLTLKRRPVQSAGGSSSGVKE